MIKAIIKDLMKNPKTRCQCDTGWVWVLEQMREAHRKGHSPHTADMMDTTGDSSAIGGTEGHDPRANNVKKITTLNEFIAAFRELHLGVHHDIMTLKNKGYGPQTFGGRDDPPILVEASKPQKQKAVHDTPATTTSTVTVAKCYMCGRAGHLKAAYT
jgi:hypothetical protein